MRNLFLGLSVLVFLLIVTGNSAASTVVFDSINAEFQPASDTYQNAHEAGWYYTPDQSFMLQGILTKFSNVPDSRTVIVEIFDSHPEDGGIIMESSGFTPSLGFTGGIFNSPVSLMGGEEYFFGFRNLSGLGVNYTDDASAIEDY